MLAVMMVEHYTSSCKDDVDPRPRPNETVDPTPININHDCTLCVSAMACKCVHLSILDQLSFFTHSFTHSLARYYLRMFLYTSKTENDVRVIWISLYV